MSDVNAGRRMPAAGYSLTAAAGRLKKSVRSQSGVKYRQKNVGRGQSEVNSCQRTDRSKMSSAADRE